MSNNSILEAKLNEESITLLKKLNNLENLSAYSSESVERVKLFIEKCSENHPWGKPYRIFTSIEDYALYHELHDEWHNLNLKERSTTKIPGVVNFHSAFRSFVCKQAEDKLSRRELLERVYSYKNKIRYDGNLGKDKPFEDWKKEFESHDEWKGLSISECKKKGGGGFITAFQKWLLKNVNSKKKRHEYISELFEIKSQGRPPKWVFKTIEEWKNYFDGVEDWRGYSTLDMLRTKEGTNFNMAFRSWCKKESNGDQEYRRQLLREIFPAKGRCTYKIGKQIVEFDSYPERIVGLMLLELNLMDKFERGKNFHVRVSDKNKSTIDFLVDDVFVEYHPLHFSEIQRGDTWKDAVKRKKNYITKPEYVSNDLLMVASIDELYPGLLKYWELSGCLSKECFNDLEKYVRNEVYKFDKKHPQLAKGAPIWTP